MKKRFDVIVDAALCLALFLGTWFTRGVSASAFVTWDEPAWVYRSVKFLLALSRGDLAGTMLVGHPGVLTMWSGALSLAWHRFITGAVSPAQLAAVDALPSLDVHEPGMVRQLVALLPLAKGGIVILHALVAVALYLLLRRLLDRRYALVGALFLASDPYYLALSRVLHIDAPASGLMLVSLLSVLVYARRGCRRYLVFSGAAAGLAALAKSYGLLVAPLAVLSLAVAHLWGPLLTDTTGRASSLRRRSFWLLRDAALWAALALVVFVALWPSMWAAPLRTLQTTLGLSFEYATTPGDATTSFFRGRLVADPGPLFYPIAMLLHTTPLVLVGSLLALLGLLFLGRGGQAGDNERRVVTVALVAYVVLYIAVITLSKKKYDRYLLPALLGADLLAALGWAGALDLALQAAGLRGASRAPARRAISGGAASFLALAQAVVLLGSLYPARYLAYYNPWAGGPARAVATIPVGWGEGVERAAQYLAAKPGARDLSVATWAVAGVVPSFGGQVLKLTEQTVADADYVLLYIGDLQSQGRLARLFYGVQEPEFAVVLNGIEYALLYPNTYYEQLSHDIARLAEPGDLIVSNAHSAFERHYQGGLRWHVVDGATDDAVAAQLQTAAAGSQHIFYLEFQSQGRVPAELIRRQLAQGALLLGQTPFAYGTLYHYLRPAGGGFHPLRAAVEVGVDFGGQLSLERCGFFAHQVQYRQEVGLGLEWRALQPIGQDYHISLRLVDEQGRWWGQRDGPLEDELFSRTSAWPQGTWHRFSGSVPLAPGIPPGRYWMVIGVYRLQDLSRLPISGPDGRAQGYEWRSGPITVDSATVPPSVEDLAIQHPADLRLGSKAQVLGYALPEGPTRSGEAVTVSLFWRCLEEMDTAYDLLLRLEREGATVATARVSPVGAYHPTDRWRRGEILACPQSLPVPAGAPSGSYSLYLNLCPKEGRPLAEHDLLLAEIQVEHRECLFVAPPIQHPLQATFGEGIEFLGFDLPEATVRPGGTLPLTLYWRAGGPTGVSYTVFTHLLDPAGAVRGQVDRVPAQGRRPTTGWIAGEILVDSYEIPVQAEASPGQHLVEIGLYDPATGQRLPVLQGGQPTGEDRILLPAAVTVQQP